MPLVFRKRKGRTFDPALTHIIAKHRDEPDHGSPPGRIGNGHIQSGSPQQAGPGANGMHGEYKVPGGKLVVVDLTDNDGHLAGVRVSGDFFLEPDSALDAINAALCGLPVDTSQAGLTAAVEAALDEHASLYGLTPEGVAIAVRRALEAGVTA
jgi:lipoate-protein ligase A